MTPTSRDIIILAIGAVASFLMLVSAAHYLAPEKPCGFDGQPDAHWQAAVSYTHLTLPTNREV